MLKSKVYTTSFSFPKKKKEMATRRLLAGSVTQLPITTTTKEEDVHCMVKLAPPSDVDVLANAIQSRLDESMEKMDVMLQAIKEKKWSRQGKITEKDPETNHICRDFLFTVFCLCLGGFFLYQQHATDVSVHTHIKGVCFDGHQRYVTVHSLDRIYNPLSWLIEVLENETCFFNVTIKSDEDNYYYLPVVVIRLESNRYEAWVYDNVCLVSKNDKFDSFISGAVASKCAPKNYKHPAEKLCLQNMYGGECHHALIRII